MARLAARVTAPARRIAPSGGMRRAVAVLAGGHAAAQLLAALASPVLARLYTPAEYGAYAAGIGLVLILVTATTMQYDVAIVVPPEDRTAADLVVAALLISLVMTAITGVVLLVAGDAILDLFGAGALHKYLWLLLLGQFAAAVYAIFTSLGTRTRDFTGLAGARVNQNVVMLALQLALSATGAAGLLIGDAAGRYAAGLRMAHRGFRSYRRSYMTTSWQRMIVATRRYRSFAVIGVWPALVSAITVYAPVLLIAAFYGPHVGGLFSLGQRLIAAPNALLVLSIGQVFMGETARRMHADPMTIAPLYRSTLTRLMKLSVPLLIVSIPASFLVGPLFGSEWKAAGTYIAILAPMYALQIVSSPFGGILDVLERQDLFLLREVIRLVLLASAVSLASALSLPAVGAVIALSAAGCLSYVAYSLISWYALRVHQRTWTAGAGPGASPSAVPAD